MSAGPYLYVPNEGDNTTSVIDTSTNTVVATIPVGGDTAAISPNGAFVYVVSESGQVAVINTATNSVVTVISVPGAAFATVAVSPNGSLVYATNGGQSAVTVIDAQTNSFITNIPVTAAPYGIAFSPDGALAYVVSEAGPVGAAGGTVSVINTATNSVLTTITVGNTPTMLAMSPDGQHVYVDNNGSGTVSVIDTSTNSVTTTINVGGNPYGIVFSPDGSHAYVANANGNVSVIDSTTNTVVDTINLGIGNVGIAVSPDGAHLYVTHYGYSPTVSVIDTATDSVVGTINVGNVPEYPAIGSAADQDKVAEVPSLTTSGNVTVSAGGSKPLGITVMPNDSDDTVSVKISNVPSFETITAPTGDVVTRNGNTYTITAPTGQPINNLVVHSSYKGKGHPQNTFTITATNLTSGETATSASKSITVTDPPPTTPGVTRPSLDHVVALFNQFIAGGFPEP